MQGRNFYAVPPSLRKIPPTQKINGFCRFLLLTNGFTEKAQGGNSFFYMYQLAPPLTLYKQG